MVDEPIVLLLTTSMGLLIELLDWLSSRISLDLMTSGTAVAVVSSVGNHSEGWGT